MTAANPVLKPGALASWLDGRMRAHNLNQHRLAAQTGIASSTLWRIRHGHIPQPRLIMTLADFFGEDFGTVAEIAGLVRLAELPVEVRNMLRPWYCLPEKERNAILRQFAGVLDLLEIA